MPWRPSLQANLFSLVLGYLLLPIGMPALYTVGPLWSLVCVGVSVVSETWFYRKRCYASVDWKMILLGNVSSSAALMVIPWIVLAVEESNPYEVRRWAPYGEWMYWPVVGGSLFAFFASYLYSVRAEENGVIPAEAESRAELADSVAVEGEEGEARRDGGRNLSEDVRKV